MEPLGQLQWLLGGENCLVSVQQRQLNAALRPLPALDLHKVDGGVAHEVCRKKIGRVIVNFQRRGVLLKDTVVHQADLRCQRHGLHLVVGDVYEGGAGLHMEPLQFIAHFQTQFGIQIGKRLVHEQHAGLGSQRPGDGHTLLLTAGQLRGIAVHEHTDFDDAGHPAHGQVDLFFGQLAHSSFHLAVLEKLKVLVEGLSLSSGLHLFFQSLYLGGHVLTLLQMIAEQLFGSVLGDGVGIDQLDDGLLFVQLAVFIPAFLKSLYHILRIFEDLCQTGSVFRLKADLRHFLLDV